MQDKYWKDYTEFIQITEELTLNSPANLLEQYQVLIEELEDQDIFEWIYENKHENYTRTKIQIVLECEKLADNILRKEFHQKINMLDERIVKFMKVSAIENNDWKKCFSPDLIDWEKIKK